jgi:hypothetical protein
MMTRRSMLIGLITVPPVLALVLALAPVPAAAQGLPDPGRGWNATPGEVAQLPQYCWAQMDPQRFKGPQYEIPRGACGGGMNHYCPGLVEQLRAKMSMREPKKRLGYLNHAKNRTLYTIKAMEKHPNCPIRADVEMTLRLVELQRRAAGGG